jgi:hypothetical protein
VKQVKHVDYSRSVNTQNYRQNSVNRRTIDLQLNSKIKTPQRELHTQRFKQLNRFQNLYIKSAFGEGPLNSKSTHLKSFSFVWNYHHHHRAFSTQQSSNSPEQGDNKNNAHNQKPLKDYSEYASPFYTPTVHHSLTDFTERN